MIGHLRGQLLKITPSLVVLDVGGVGYEVRIPLSTYYELQRLERGATASLHIHTHVRDDALALFGFRTEREREIFEHLIAISGIGPRLAQTVLSGMAPDELIAAIAAGDLRRLASIPGIGKKTAERMLVELRDRIRELAAEMPPEMPPTDGDLVAALVNLGYRQAAAEQAVARVMRKSPDLAFADMLRESLKLLSRA